ncbi:MAG: DUF882 domain-containing protein [Phenylobacterium sp.]|uniref:DUF882 domain-containing protein n=1 Tax=Phenylobacterium sp. TaxID=1871053 RepID=UPI0025D5A85C|nr:DUF882 domain-containing protein [Phenylobacterium sp.]MCA3712031.1 DUF882 domain-containing protein [Phenylobacterium sp.]MCA6239944.1 DUF882 domain-containing protein [Phenylobacterium sp.]
MIGRRHLLAGALGLATPSLIAGGASAAAPRRLSLLNLHTGEKLAATYFEAGRYLPDALAALNHVLRDHRTGEAYAMAPGLLDLVAVLAGRFGASDAVQVISGYRSPASNAALHARSGGVATRSLHMQGMAMDIRIPGVALASLRDAALALGRGGVGFYPASDFVHVDVGRVRRW